VSKPSKFSGNLNLINNFYDVEDDEDQLKEIQNILTKTDYSFASSFKKMGKVSVKFEFRNNRIYSRRFQKFIPLIFRSKKTDSILYKYQLDGVERLRSGRHRILADDMGLGKTLQVIKALEEEAFFLKINTFIIFCPISLIENWRSEIGKWASEFEVEEYSFNNAQKQLARSNYLIVAYSRMERFFSEIDPQTISNTISIFDEAHKLRNEGAKVNKIANKIKSNKKWLLTGTPLERDEKDIENILSLLDPGISVAHLTKNSFLSKSRFANITLRRTKVGVLDHLPPVIREIHYLELLEDQRKEYSDLLEKQKNLPKKEKIGILTKLLMSATCSETGSSNKIEKAVKITTREIRKNNKVIIFSNFNIVLEKMSKALASNDIRHHKINGELDKDERQKRIDSFRSSDTINALVINIAVGSEGLTLTEANVVIFLNEWWNPSTNRQAEDRVNRIGQHKDVTVHILRSLQTLDLSLEKILIGKNILEKEYLDLLLEDISQC